MIDDRAIRKLLIRTTEALVRANPSAGHDFIDDVIGEMFLRWSEDAPGTIQGDEDLSFGWLFVRGQHYLIDILRRGDKTERLSEDGPDAQREDDFTAGQAIHQELEMYLSALGPRSYEQIVAITFHDLFGFSMPDVARILQCSESAAAHHHTRGMEALRKIAQGGRLPERRNSPRKRTPKK